MNSTSLVSRFPQELIDKVIEENETDTPTLRACALVCRSFLHASQARIFSAIELDPSPEPSGSQQRSLELYPIFIDSRHLCTYVRALRLMGRCDAVDPSVISLLGMLDYLTSFEIDAQYPYFQWDTLPEDLRKAICELCARSPLARFRLFELGKVTQMEEFASLVASPALTDLVLADIVLPPLDDGSMVAYRGIKLTRCSLNVDKPTFDVVMSWLGADEAFAYLRSLNLVWVPETTSHIQRIIDVSASSLAQLSLIIPDGPSTYAPNTLVLDHARALRIVKMMLVFPVEETAMLAPWLAELLRDASAVVEIVLVMDFFSPINAVAPFPQIDWAPLASVRFPGLRRLALEIVAPFQTPEELEMVVDEAKRGLRGLEERGVLECSGRVAEDAD
ncbi:hypothetical protein FB451DRAFT_698510 [Mycena latifolia]|nr:hypothetical protein FB451DRAFT_698510 [Mycena latifolia]